MTLILARQLCTRSFSFQYVASERTKHKCGALRKVGGSKTIMVDQESCFPKLRSKTSWEGLPYRANAGGVVFGKNWKTALDTVNFHTGDISKVDIEKWRIDA